jgi:hypothetical protein
MAMNSRRRLAAAAVFGGLAIAAPTLAFALSTMKASPSTESPLRGIAAAATAPSGEHAVDPRSWATLQELNARGLGERALGEQLIADARVMPTTVDGKALYLIPTARGGLCTFLEGGIETCGAPLSDTNPAVIIAVDDDGPGGVGPMVFGVAQDGIDSITIKVSGQRLSVTVNRNVFEYHATSSARAADVVGVVATRTDGTILGIK